MSCPICGEALEVVDLRWGGYAGGWCWRCLATTDIQVMEVEA